MLDIIDPRCSECFKAKGGICFKMNVSRLEEGLGIEKFKCDHCGQEYSFKPKDFDRNFKRIKQE